MPRNFLEISFKIYPENLMWIYLKVTLYVWTLLLLLLLGHRCYPLQSVVVVADDWDDLARSGISIIVARLLLHSIAFAQLQLLLALRYHAAVVARTAVAAAAVADLKFDYELVWSVVHGWLSLCVFNEWLNENDNACGMDVMCEAWHTS